MNIKNILEMKSFVVILLMSSLALAMPPREISRLHKETAKEVKEEEKQETKQEHPKLEAKAAVATIPKQEVIIPPPGE